MTDQVPVKIRCIAAIYHLLFAIAPGWLLITTLIWLNNREHRSAYPVTDLTVVINIFMELIFSCGISFFLHLLCALTYRIHPFVDLVGRDAIRQTCNRLIILVIILFVILLANVDAITYTGIIIYYCIEATYFANSVVCGILSIRGYHFKNRLLIPFIKD